MANNRIKTDAGKLAEALRGKVLGRRGLCGALDRENPMSIDQIGITESDFNESVPLSLKPYIHVASLLLPSQFAPFLDAFRIAVKCIEPRTRVVRPLEIIIGKAPFELRLGNGNLRYTPKNDQVINVNIDDRMIFLDAEKMMRYPKELQVACILEEFAHTIMNISDETFVSHVVALMYEGVTVIDGKYHARTNGER